MTQGGFELEVGDLPEGRWSLAGDARIVAEGEILPGALADPAPPLWIAPASQAGEVLAHTGPAGEVT
jgi:hypothetical protein